MKTFYEIVFEKRSHLETYHSDYENIYFSQEVENTMQDLKSDTFNHGKFIFHL
jgi:hypothetical protein